MKENNFVGLGQYDEEYRNCPCFWGSEPGKFVKLLPNLLQEGNILDLGAGEGKNSIFLAKLNFNITSVECSPFAIRNFESRLSSMEGNIKKNIVIIQQDVNQYLPREKYDCVIAYGLLHCLKSENHAFELIQKMKSCTKKNGYNVIVTFTPELPVPEIQSYLEPTLIKSKTLKSWYNDWLTIEFEDEIITETHPTSEISHQHSLCRLIVKNDKDGME